MSVYVCTNVVSRQAGRGLDSKRRYLETQHNGGVYIITRDVMFTTPSKADTATPL
jgi:hypothetical protein